MNSGTGNAPALSDSSPEKDWFDRYLDKYPDLPSVVLIRSMEVKHFPREFLSGRILDVCCGDGFFMQCLGVSDAVGCDIDEQALNAVRAKHIYNRAVNCDARNLVLFGDAHFDTVISNCGLEHVDGIEKALQSIARVLKPGGRLVMSVPDQNLNSWFFPAAVCKKIGMASYASRLCEEYNKKQQHLNIYPYAGWRKRLEQSGFAMEKSFSLFREREYRIITFFESFALDSFPGALFRKVYRMFKKVVPLEHRKRIWRRLLKPIYRRSAPAETGGELFIVARKRTD